MFVHVRSNADNCRISSTGNGQQKLKQLNETVKEGANRAPYFSLRNLKEKNHEK